MAIEVCGATDWTALFYRDEVIYEAGNQLTLYYFCRYGLTVTEKPNPPYTF